MIPKREGIMLCYPAEEKRITKLNKTILVQPKLNGERARVEWFNDEPVLLSSYGNEFKFNERIRDYLVDFPSLPWDGELYRHGWSRERIHSAVSRKAVRNKDIDEIKLHIFDAQLPGVAQISRSKTVHEIFAHAMPSDPVEIVLTDLIDRDLWLVKAQEYIAGGYEGIILRDPFGTYENKRMPTILKFKPTEFDEYEIVGVEQEVSIHGELKNSLGAFKVTSDEGTVFNVGTGPALTKPLREHFWKIRAELPGKKLKVKHELLNTVGGIPIACVAVEVL